MRAARKRNQGKQTIHWRLPSFRIYLKPAIGPERSRPIECVNRRLYNHMRELPIRRFALEWTLVSCLGDMTIKSSRGIFYESIAKI
jgi:hypothetical protein